MGVKRAKGLTSFSEFKIKKSQLKKIKQHYDKDVQRAIYEGRLLSYNLENGYIKASSLKPLSIEFINRLDELHLLRHDLTKRSFCINYLYASVYGGDAGAEEIPIWYSGMDNEKYENWINPTDEEIEKIDQVLKQNLSDRHYQIVIRECGFINEGLWEYCGCENDESKYDSKAYQEAIGEYGTACNILRFINVLPKTFQDMRRMIEVNSILVKLSEMPDDAAYKSYRHYIRKLSDEIWTPYQSSQEIVEFMLTGALDFNPIVMLNLSKEALLSLRSTAGITTIADVAHFPKEKWGELNIYHRGEILNELEAKMHARGYTSFSFLS